MPESSSSASAASRGGGRRTAPVDAPKDSPPAVEGGEDCILSSRCRKKRTRAKAGGGSASTQQSKGELGGMEVDEAVENEDEGGDLMMPAPRLSQRGAAPILRSGEHAAPRLNQRQVRVHSMPPLLSALLLPYFVKQLFEAGGGRAHRLCRL
jgi:hypothetical protein